MSDILVCRKCHRYFDQKSGEPISETRIEEVHGRDFVFCKPCTEDTERQQWAANGEAR